MNVATDEPTAWDRLQPSLVHHIVNSLGWPSLRPLQQQAIDPVMNGDDALLLAPTAGGKTEAAMFPMLSRMVAEQWTGTSVLYVCPLKALLNNLLPRLETYSDWVGRTAALWHGDTTAGARRRILRERPDVLLTTPESLEAMLVSANVDHHAFFGGVRSIVVDEVHAFAGDDRGWHLLAVLERVTRVVGRPIQRVGLSATVGNPGDLLTWLQGAGANSRPARVVVPNASARPAGQPSEPPPGDIALDFVGTISNAATVIEKLHRGEKRLVFCDSRTLVEQLGAALRERGLTVFLSHASLSLDERRRSETAFAEARDCVIVSTSTLELGIDVGDLDRVIQVGASATVAAFLQRLGRTGRRAETIRNCLFLALTEEDLVQAAGLLTLWARHWVEPVVAPPEPRHIAAQQLLALCLQEHQVGGKLWPEAWNGLAGFGSGNGPIVSHLVAGGYVDSDDGMLFIGPEAEKRFGHRHFMNLTAVFTAAPQFTVLSGRREIGRTDPSLLTDKVAGPRRLLLAGRSWQVTYIDWVRKRCFVDPVDSGGRARWISPGLSARSFDLMRAMREVLLGADPPVKLSQRAVTRLDAVRADAADVVHADSTVIVRRDSGDLVWWTWAGMKANLTLVATLGGLADPNQRCDDMAVRLRADLVPDQLRAGLQETAGMLVLPDVDPRAVRGLKFNEALPERLATSTLAARLADFEGAQRVLREPFRFNSSSGS
ncbi:DEAD/DEAH box helicase [Actinospica robiniae]|uniref:DEAD/DEAH box helicase n=1 Tax=Actinospica robiniae TaxID=304901 RepID=UPI00040A99DE|nr:DEAD/DEAH box helicase [Actinospica robiniae]